MQTLRRALVLLRRLSRAQMSQMSEVLRLSSFTTLELRV